MHACGEVRSGCRSVTAMGVVRSSLTLSGNDQYMKVSPFDGEHENIDVWLYVIDLRTREISGGLSRYMGARIPDQGCAWVNLNPLSSSGDDRRGSLSVSLEHVNVGGQRHVDGGLWY